MILGWTALRPSVREQRWRRAALLAALGVTLALLWAALAGDPRRPVLLWTALSLASIMLAVGALRTGRRTAAELCIGDDGAILVREAALPDAPVHAMHCAFRAPWLITLAHGTMWLAVWPDCLPPEAFRRLWACVRWAPSGASQVSVDADGPGSSGGHQSGSEAVRLADRRGAG